MTEWLNQLGNTPGAVLTVPGMVLTAWMLGVLLLRWLVAVGGDAERRRSSRFVPGEWLVALVVGLNLLALSFFLLGCVGWLNGGTVSIMLAGGCAGALVLAVMKPHIPSNPPLGRRAWGLWPVIIGFAILTLGNALTHPIGWDELSYHITVPFRWMSSGSPVVFSDNPYSGFPSLPEFLFWGGIEAGGILAPRLLMWVADLVCLGLLAALLKPKTDVSVIMLIAVAASPITLMCASQCYVEPLLAADLLAALVLLQKTNAKNRNAAWRGVVALGVLAGGAMAVKLTGAAIALSIFASMAMVGMFGRREWKGIVIFILSAGLFALPFYLRPWLATGNPLHPYFAGWFTTDPAALACSTYHHAIGSVKYGVDGLAGMVCAPVLLAFGGRWFDECFGWQLILLLAAGLFAAIRAVSSKDWRALIPAVLIAMLYIFWLASSRQSRFLLPAFFLLPLAAAPFIMRFEKKQRLAMSGLLLASVFIMPPTSWVRHFLQSWRGAAGKVPVQNHVYSGTGDGYLAAMDMINALVPPTGRVALLFEHRGLYVPRDYVIVTPFFQSARFTPPEGVDAEALVDELHAAGVSHLLVGVSPKDPDRLAEYFEGAAAALSPSLRAAHQRKWLKTLWGHDGYVLYELSPIPNDDS